MEIKISVQKAIKSKVTKKSNPKCESNTYLQNATYWPRMEGLKA